MLFLYGKLVDNGLIGIRISATYCKAINYKFSHNFNYQPKMR